MPGVLRILQRRAHLAEGEARAAALRLVARTTEEHLGVDAAIDAWREVLVAGGESAEAAARLLALAGDGPRFLDVASWVEGALEGAARAALLTRMARRELDANREEDAIAHLEAAVSGEEIDAAGATLLVDLYNQRGDLGGAERVLTALTAAAPSTEAWLALARLRQTRRGDRDGAATAYQGALDLDPNHPEALAFLGAWHHEAGRFAEALPLFVARSTSIEDGADLTDFDVRLEVATFWRRLAAMLVEASRTEEALAAFRNVLRFNPSDAPTLEAVAPLLVAQGAWAEAGDVLERLLALSGGQGEPARIARYYQWLGEVDAANGNVERAYKRFAKATELDRTNVRAWFGVAGILRARRSLAELMPVYNEVIHHATETSDLVRACLEKGQLLDEMGKLDKAVQHFERALEWAPERADVWLHVAEAGLRMDQPEAAREAARRGLTDPATAPSLVAKLQAVAWLASEALSDAVSAEASKAASEAADPSVIAGLGGGNWASRAEAMRAAVAG
jgi:tetratricopeptide (TPR) repeat protein